MIPWTFIAFPLVGAAIGYVTNTIAVKMIFRPREPKNLGFITVQGLLPKRRSDLAKSVANTVERDLISGEQIRELVGSVLQGDAARSVLHERIDTLIDEQLAKFGPMVASFLPQDKVSAIKDRIEREILAFAQDLALKLDDHLENELDIRAMVEERIEGFDITELERIVHEIASKELRHIEVLGAFLGAVVGLAQAAITEWIIRAG